MILEVGNIRFSYDMVEALKGISFSISRGEILGIIGSNGAGKSTLLKCINKLLEPSAGTVLLDGCNLLAMGRREIARVIGFVPQGTGLRLPMSVLDTVVMGRFPHIGRFSSEGRRDLEAAHEAMLACGIEHLSDRISSELSGGEYQRTVIARALAQEPKILLLDEPTLHLDIGHQLEILELLRKLTSSKGLITAMVVHDLNLAMHYSDKIIVIKDGAVFKAGPASETITPEVLRDVYSLKAEFIRTPAGRSFIMPVEILKAKEE